MRNNIDIVSLIRSQNLIKCIDEEYINVHNFCKVKNLDYSTIFKYVNNKLKIGDNVVKKLEIALGVTEGTLDIGLAIQRVELLPIIKTLTEYNQVFINKESFNTYLQVNIDIINAIGESPETLFISQINDDSMEPTIHENSLLIISNNQTNIISNKIYAIMYKDKLLIRRIQENLSNNTIWLIPDSGTYFDNSFFNKIELPLNDVVILGRVRYLMGECI